MLLSRLDACPRDPSANLGLPGILVSHLRVWVYQVWVQRICGAESARKRCSVGGRSPDTGETFFQYFLR